MHWALQSIRWEGGEERGRERDLEREREGEGTALGRKVVKLGLVIFHC